MKKSLLLLISYCIFSCGYCGTDNKSFAQIQKARDVIDMVNKSREGRKYEDLFEQESVEKKVIFEHFDSNKSPSKNTDGKNSTNGSNPTQFITPISSQSKSQQVEPVKKKILIPYFKVLQNYVLSVPGKPQKPSVSPNGKFVLVPSYENNYLSYISVYKDNVNVEKFTIPTGKGPKNIIISKNNRRAFVTNELDDTISIIALDDQDSQIIKTIKTGRRPNSIVFGLDEKYLYVTNKEDNTVTVIKDDGDNSEIVNILKVESAPTSIKLSEKNQNLYVVNKGNNSVSTIDITNPAGRVLETVINTGMYPVDIAFNKENNIALITNAIDNNISIVNVTTEPAYNLGNIANRSRPTGITSDLKENFAIAVNSLRSSLDFFNLSKIAIGSVTNIKADPIMIPAEPAFISYSPNGVLAINHPNKNIVSVIVFKLEHLERFVQE